MCTSMPLITLNNLQICVKLYVENLPLCLLILWPKQFQHDSLIKSEMGVILVLLNERSEILCSNISSENTKLLYGMMMILKSLL
jgi:hypothetical protein